MAIEYPHTHTYTSTDRLNFLAHLFLRLYKPYIQIIIHHHQQPETKIGKNSRYPRKITAQSFDLRVSAREIEREKNSNSNKTLNLHE